MVTTPPGWGIIPKTLWIDNAPPKEVGGVIYVKAGVVPGNSRLDGGMEIERRPWKADSLPKHIFL